MAINFATNVMIASWRTICRNKTLKKTLLNNRHPEYHLSSRKCLVSHLRIHVHLSCKAWFTRGMRDIIYGFLVGSVFSAPFVLLYIYYYSFLASVRNVRLKFLLTSYKCLHTRRTDVTRFMLLKH